MDINVREVMDVTPVVKEEGMFKEHKPYVEDVWNRIKILKQNLDDIQHRVNDVYVGDTEESWKVAYEVLYSAFKNCIAEEKKIIVRD